MITLVGFANMDKPAFQQILDGNFKCPDTCDPYLCKLIPYLSKPEHTSNGYVYVYRVQMQLGKS